MIAQCGRRKEIRAILHPVFFLVSPALPGLLDPSYRMHPQFRTMPHPHHQAQPMSAAAAGSPLLTPHQSQSLTRPTPVYRRQQQQR